MANNKQGCRECKFLQTAKSAVESKRKAGNSIREDFHLSSLGARWSRTLSSARLSPVATWQVRSTASESPIPLPLTCIVVDTAGAQHLTPRWQRPQSFGRYSFRETHSPRRILAGPSLWILRHSWPFCDGKMNKK